MAVNTMVDSIIKGVYKLDSEICPIQLNGYNKLASLFLLNRLGLPTLDGLVVTDWNKNIEEYVLNFVDIKKWKQVLIRTDKKNETGRYMRGGYRCSIEKLSEEINRILSLGRIVYFLEPTNKYHNHYGINLGLFEESPNIAHLEIVGHGFDISDINRGDISPHEVIQLRINNYNITNSIVNRNVITNNEYKKSVLYRLEKIGREVVARGNHSSSDTLKKNELINIGKKYLQKSGNNLLLNHQNKYIELPRQVLNQYVEYIKCLPAQLMKISTEKMYVMSCSIIYEHDSKKPRFIFWDIVFSSKKYSLN